MSRPLKLKATGACLSAFELPDLGFIGLFAGAHRRRLPARDEGVSLALFSNQADFPLRRTDRSCSAVPWNSIF